MPDRGFLDEELEGKSRALLTHVAGFAKCVGDNLFTDKGGLFLCVSPHWGAERKGEIYRELEELSDEMVQAYDDLVRAARAKLKC